MPRSAIILDIFLSSPSDLPEERSSSVEIVREWNHLRSSECGVFFNVITWEDVVASDLSDRGQSSINEQVGDSYDIYLGMMWSRFGAPTGVAETGTVEEYERAIERYRGGEKIRIAMLFKTADIPYARLDGEQIVKIKEFKRRFSEDGGLYGEFDSEKRFNSQLNRILENVAKSYNSQVKANLTDGGGLAETTYPSNALTVPESTNITEVYVEKGLLEVSSDLSIVSERMSLFLDKFTNITDKTTQANIYAVAQLEEMGKLGSFDADRTATIVNSIAYAMNESADYIDDNLEEFKMDSDELTSLTASVVDLANDFHNENDEVAKAVQSVIDSLIEQERALRGAMVAVLSLPRLATKISSARQRFVKTHTKLVDEISRIHIALKNTIS